VHLGAVFLYYFKDICPKEAPNKTQIEVFAEKEKLFNFIFSFFK